MPDIHSPAADLDESWRRLTQRWEEVTAVWDDAVRRDFAQRYWDPLQAETLATGKAMAAAAALLAQAQRSVR